MIMKFQTVPLFIASKIAEVSLFSVGDFDDIYVKICNKQVFSYAFGKEPL